MDRQAEADIAGPGNFLSNFEPITIDAARALVEHVVEFDQYSEPMKRLLEKFVERPETDYVVSSAHPRMVDGKRSTNPRYLQRRPDLANPRELYLAQTAARLARGIPADQPVYFPVNSVLAGRRNSPADPKAGLPPLAVYNPIHYQELPELFMDFICSLTGKSPATTGFGSEGALTKAAFNALPPVVDLNNALVSFILTGYAGFTTSAGYVGPHLPRGPRHQPAGPGDLVPHAGARARPRISDRHMGTWKRSPISVWTDARCWPAAWATALRRSSWTGSWGGFSRRPTRFSPRRCCARRSRTWSSSRRAWTPLWKRR